MKRLEKLMERYRPGMVHLDGLGLCVDFAYEEDLRRAVLKLIDPATDEDAEAHDGHWR